jgi:hypothetical protein
MSRLLVLELPHIIRAFISTGLRPRAISTRRIAQERIRKVELSDDVLSGFRAAPSEKPGC